MATNMSESQIRILTPPSSISKKNDDGGESKSIVDPFLMDILSNSRDRVTCLKVENECIRLINGTEVNQVLIPATNSYLRLIVHRVAAYYGLAHASSADETIDTQPNGVIITKIDGCGVPGMLLSELEVNMNDDVSASTDDTQVVSTTSTAATSAATDDNNNDNMNSSSSDNNADTTTTTTTVVVSQKSFKIMKRNPHKPANPADADAAVITNSGQSSDTNPDPEAAELQKREEEYAAARARIFDGIGDSNELLAAAAANDTQPRHVEKTMNLLKNLNVDAYEEVDKNDRLAEQWAESHLYDRRLGGSGYGMAPALQQQQQPLPLQHQEQAQWYAEPSYEAQASWSGVVSGMMDQAPALQPHPMQPPPQQLQPIMMPHQSYYQPPSMYQYQQPSLMQPIPHPQQQQYQQQQQHHHQQQQQQQQQQHMRTAPTEKKKNFALNTAAQAFVPRNTSVYTP